MAADGIEIEHPNRKKASSKATRLIVVVLLLGPRIVIGHLGRRLGEARGREGDAGHLHRPLRPARVPRRALEPRRAAGRRGARDRALHLRPGLRARLVRARSAGVRRAGALRRRRRAPHRAARPVADPAHRLRDARLPAGVERRGRASARSAAAAPDPAPLPPPPPPRLLCRPPGWWNWSDTTASKAVELRLVRVRVPPRVSARSRRPRGSAATGRLRLSARRPGAGCRRPPPSSSAPSTPWSSASGGDGRARGRLPRATGRGSGRGRGRASPSSGRWRRASPAGRAHADDRPRDLRVRPLGRTTNVPPSTSRATIA